MNDQDEKEIVKHRMESALLVALVLTLAYCILLLSPIVIGLFVDPENMAWVAIISEIKPSETFNSIWLLVIGYLVGKTQSDDRKK